MTTGRTTLRDQHGREHHWDSMRALLMLLGIPYHVAMAYRAGQVWILNSGEGAPFFTHLAQTIHVFRMPAFFIIAGYFAALLLARRAPGDWLGGRAARLSIPFVAAIVTINPLLNILCELSNHSLPAALESWKLNSMASGGYWVRHLWFLIVLLYLSAAAAALCWIEPPLRRATLSVRTDHRLAGKPLQTMLVTALSVGIWEAVAIELFYANGLATNLLQQVLRLDQVIEFAPYFLIGCLIARAPALKAMLYRFSPAAALFAIAALCLDLAVRDALWAPLGRFLDTFAAIGITQLLFATIKRIADRPNRHVQEMVRASFVIYLVHLPIVALLVLIGQQIAAPLMLKVPLIMVATLALSYGSWSLIRRSPALRLLYDGVRRPAAKDLPLLATSKLSRL